MADQNYPPEESTEETLTVPIFNEAPAVVFTQLYKLAKDGQPYQINLTVRALTPEAAVDTLMRGMIYAFQKHGFTTSKPNGQAQPTENGNGNHAPAPAQAPQPAPANGTPPPPPTGTSTNPPGSTGGAGVAQKPAFTINAVRMEVIPAANNKVTVKWYEQGHKWPDITAANWDASRMLQAMAPLGWTADHFRVAGDYPVNQIVTYVEGKLNQNNKPYKDFVGATNG